ncbi:molybdenum cofactor biosynthesis protein MoaE [soil metagenome]
MQINVKFFAIVRERLGKSEMTLDLPEGSTIADARAPVDELAGDAAPLVQRSMTMLNQEYAGPEDVLSDGDEIAFIPPVSGGDHYRVHPDALDAGQIATTVEDDGAGALVTFVGVVRDNARGRKVQWLDYEAYPEGAEKMLARIGNEMREKWPVLKVAIEHRTGKLAIGEASVVIEVSSAHRDAAFEASAYAIERIKEIVPVWKKEFYEDGETWIGSEHDYQVEIGRIAST